MSSNPSTDQSPPSTRWWEGYLVRYLIGTITGAACAVLIALAVAGDVLISKIATTEALALPAIFTPLALSAIAAGFLLCYVASTPITVIHAARMLGPHPSRSWLKPSLMWMVWWAFALLSLIFVLSANAIGRLHGYSTDVFLIVLAVPAAYVLIAQLAPMLALIEDEAPRENAGNGSVSANFRRWLLKGFSPDFETRQNKFVSKYHELALARAQAGTNDFRQTYTHLREHSNSIFIVALEISFTALLILVLGASSAGTWRERILVVGIFGLLWMAPTIFIWAQANRLEATLAELAEKLKTAAQNP